MSLPDPSRETARAFPGICRLRAAGYRCGRLGFENENEKRETEGQQGSGRMIQGLYTAAGGMIATENRQAVIANNIANASTPGYKTHSPVQLGFYQVFTGKLQRPFRFDTEAAPAGGVKIVETYPDMRTGILRDTDNPFNVALEGPGFLVLDTPRGERYSRAGDFVVDGQGQLSTADGFKVQSVSGQPIDVRGGRVNIGRDGQVTVDGAEAGQLRLVEFEQPTRLVREGSNLFSASDELREKSAAAANTIVEQGSLEMSNVDLPREMIQMMLGMRAYEANQRVIQGIDASIGQLIEQVGMS